MKVSPQILMMAVSYLRVFPESNALLTFLFHGLFRNEIEMNRGLVNSPQKITVSHMRQFIEYFLGCGYCFISPDAILRGLDPAKKYALITFDDGYYNNHLMRTLLEEYKIPALFFITTNNVRDNKGFWWDIMYREALKRNKPLALIRREERHLKTKTAFEIEQYLLQQFGSKALKPMTDTDRPFTPSELKDFAKNSFVHLGNHTSDHAILTNYEDVQVRRQIVECQEYLFALTGESPIALSYPNGNYNKKIVSIAIEIGLRIGITVEPGKNYLSSALEKNKFLNLGRFTLKGNRRFIREMETIRSDFSLKNKIKQLMLRNY